MLEDEKRSLEKVDEEARVRRLRVQSLESLSQSWDLADRSRWREDLEPLPEWIRRKNAKRSREIDETEPEAKRRIVEITTPPAEFPGPILERVQRPSSVRSRLGRVYGRIPPLDFGERNVLEIEEEGSLEICLPPDELIL